MEVFPLSYGMAKSLSHLLLWWLYLFGVFWTFCYRSKAHRAAALWHTGTHLKSIDNITRIKHNVWRLGCSKFSPVCL